MILRHILLMGKEFVNTNVENIKDFHETFFYSSRQSVNVVTQYPDFIFHFHHQGMPDSFDFLFIFVVISILHFKSPLDGIQCQHRTNESFCWSASTGESMSESPYKNVVSSTLLHQQCSASLPWVFCKMGGKWPYNWSFFWLLFLRFSHSSFHIQAFP